MLLFAIYKLNIRKGQACNCRCSASAAPERYALEAAAAQAAHDALVALYPDFTTQLDTRLASDLAEVTSDAARDNGVQVGHTVAAAILTARANDGSSLPMHYVLNPKFGTWRPDPQHPNQMPVGPEWGNVTTFALRTKNWNPNGKDDNSNNRDEYQ